MLAFVIWLAEKIQEVVEHELGDADTLKQKLLHLQLMLEMDQISQADFSRQESELLARLDEISKAKESSHA